MGERSFANCFFEEPLGIFCVYRYPLYSAPLLGVDKRRSILQAKPYTQSRIRSAKEKEGKGMPLSAILQSPSAKANGAAVSPYKNRIAASPYKNSDDDTA